MLICKPFLGSAIVWALAIFVATDISSLKAPAVVSLRCRAPPACLFKASVLVYSHTALGLWPVVSQRAMHNLLFKFKVRSIHLSGYSRFS